jgi:hypothetical protein
MCGHADRFRGKVFVASAAAWANANLDLSTMRSSQHECALSTPSQVAQRLPSANGLDGFGAALY